MKSVVALETGKKLEGDEDGLGILNFPPTEIYRKQSDKYVELNQEKAMTFLYPCDVPRRTYQYDISQVCFKHNTLVCLPTGTGKTFIAAVVIMNFYRWFPKSLIIFCATTRALVEQQINACNKYTNIPESDTVVLVGSTNSELRKNIWDDYRVVYATPQTIENEIKKDKLNPSKIALIVFDEAHHAHGKHSYCNITRSIAERSSQFRVLGLSATPGSNIDSIQDIIYNLMISKIVYKDDTDQDIAQYQHKTDIEYITVKADGDDEDVTVYLNQCIQFLANPLQNAQIITTMDTNYLSRGAVFMAMNKYKSQGTSQLNYHKNMSYLLLLLSLTAMKEKLQKYGASFLDKAIKEFEKKPATQERKILMSQPSYIQLSKKCQRMTNSSHPKLTKLQSILEEFFANSSDSRCIIFASLRDVAKNIEQQIRTVKNVKCHVFTGKSSTETDEGINEKEQQAIVNLFRKGNINTIIATCVAEEGLDIGEVDLIVCYDVQASALRTFQRIGRTGRKRAGRVIFLLSEGVEERALNKALRTKNEVKDLLTNSLKKFVLYEPLSPNLPLPENMQCIKLLVENEKIDNSILGYFTRSQLSQQKKAKKPVLGSKENIEMKSTFTKEFKYRKLNFGIKTATKSLHVHGKLFNHSMATIILNTFAYSYNESQEETIEAKTAELFKVETDSESSLESDLEDEKPKREVVIVKKQENNNFISDDEEISVSDSYSQNSTAFRGSSQQKDSYYTQESQIKPLRNYLEEKFNESSSRNENIQQSKPTTNDNYSQYSNREINSYLSSRDVSQSSLSSESNSKFQTEISQNPRNSIDVSQNYRTEASLRDFMKSSKNISQNHRPESRDYSQEKFLSSSRDYSQIYMTESQINDSNTQTYSENHKFLSSDDDEKVPETFLSDSSEQQSHFLSDSSDEDLDEIVRQAEKEYYSQHPEQAPKFISDSTDSDSDSDVVILSVNHKPVN